MWREVDVLEAELKRVKDELDSSHSDVSFHSSLTCECSRLGGSFTVLNLVNRLYFMTELFFCGIVRPRGCRGNCVIQKPGGRKQRREQPEPLMRSGGWERLSVRWKKTESITKS